MTASAQSRPVRASDLLVARVAHEAMAHVLGRDHTSLSPRDSLAVLGVDSIALVMWADVVDDWLASALGIPVRVPDALVRDAHTLSDLIERLQAHVGGTAVMPRSTTAASPMGGTA